MGIFEQAGGASRWLGTFDFEGQDCQNHVRLIPNNGQHISEALADSYDPEDLQTFDLSLVADIDLVVGMKKFAMEEWQSEANGGPGYIDIFVITQEEPLLAWTKDIARLHPSVDVRLDYQRAATDLFGRWQSVSGVVKECHLTPVEA